MGHHSECGDPGSIYTWSFQSYAFPPLKFALLPFLIYSVRIYSVPISHTVWALTFAQLSIMIGEEHVLDM